VINAIGHIAKAIGMTKIAEETGWSRPNLYIELSDGAKPQFATIMKVLKVIGGQIKVNPVSTWKKTNLNMCKNYGVCAKPKDLWILTKSAKYKIWYFLVLNNRYRLLKDLIQKDH
jgi:hypothetical protein